MINEKVIPIQRMRFVATFFTACLLLANSARAERPNVVVFLTDDQGWGDLSVHGNTNIATPRIDSLAREGVLFDRFYVCAVCSPTRAEFLTGRYHARSGVYSTSAGGERMDLDEKTIADTFRAGGYRTGAFGKWHNGMQYPYHPNGRGFDEYYGFCSGHWGDYFSPPLERNGQLVQGEGFCVDDFTNQAMKFMEASVAEDKPFFAYLPYNTPHSPMQVPDEFWNRFKDKELALHNREPNKENPAHVRCALAMCENIDWNVGRVLDKLQELQIDDNTIVVYFCDNGPNGVRWNGDMKGRKGSTDEGGVRSPLLIRWPDQLEAGRKVTPIASVTDLHPTLAALCGIDVASEKTLDGISLASLLLDREMDTMPDRMIVNHWKTKCSIRNQRFRLGTQGKLFEIATDAGQRVDVKDKFPGVAKELMQRKQAYLAEVQGWNNDSRPFLIGHPDYLYTQVPARDATGTGKIKRSNKFPNCSYLFNWTSTTERIQWEAQVGASGRYRVELQYACKPENVGGSYELRFGDAKLPFNITEAHDPPLRGMEHDHVERIESYVKDFKSIELGTVELEAGSGTLEIVANSIPGEEAFEFRLLMLTRIE
ncbi:MAG: arylsulfatase [Planctomycetota bacterium]